MKRTTTAIIACLLTPLAATAAGNYYYSAQTLYDMAERDPTAFLGYIAGVHDSTRGRGWFYIPPAVELGQAGNVVLTALRKVPESRRQIDAYVLVQATLATAWPCPKPTKSEGG